MNTQLQLMLQQAIQAFQCGNFDSANLLLKRVLQVDSKNLPALHVLGLIKASQAHYREAADFLGRAARINPNDASIQYNLAKALADSGSDKEALAHHKRAVALAPNNPEAWLNYGKTASNLARHEDSLVCYSRALSLKPDYHEAWVNKGNTLHELKRFDEAITHYDQALSLKPDDHEAWVNKGNTLHELKRFDEAITHYDQALSLKPDYHEAWVNKGVTLHELKRFDEAITHYDQALSLKPDDHEAWVNKGNTLHELKRFDEAITHYDQALSLKPDYHEAWVNKGVTLHELKRFDEAITHYDQALSLKPDYHEAWVNKGVTLHELKRFDEAITHYDQALSLKPDYHEAWVNKGVTLHELKRFDEAITHYDQALSLKPDYHEASWNKSLSLLLQGDFENGLILYESRWGVNKVSEIIGRQFFDKPTWLGAEPLQDKTILLYGEQGLGDYIQFSRYTKLVSDLGAKVILEVPESLASLMQTLDGISQLVIKGEVLPQFDYQCPLLSLPLALRTNISTIPAGAPYLTSHPIGVAEWKLILGEKSKKRIGLVWSSISGFKDDSKRSLRLSDFVSALPLEGFEYVCLQKELKECDKDFFRSYKNIRFVGDQLRDFSDTASLIDSLDLVISTCTSVPHLSAALGKETWVLLSHVPDWRWFLGRVDSPWYASIKLYRQSRIGDWDMPLENIRKDLLALIS